MKKLFEKRMTNFRSLTLVGIILLSVVFVACEKEGDDFVAPASQDVSLKSAKAIKKTDSSIAMVAINGGFSELVGALAYVDGEMGTGLVDMFMNGTDQYTVFAPTNDAFFALYDALGAEKISDLPAALVYDVLLYHVTDGRRAANSVVPKNGTRDIETLLGATFMVHPDLSIEAVGNMANIVAANVSASNGIVHVIDAVILPITVE
ncbi:fasciclin domain-containing protein [Sunxiuqinia sp. A32]|uniref:fasciclin domain-containing protein n=1 Tax=Sunxiuqinia sp. A32 TaxID=3461496 RepID=UPI004045A75D